MRRPDPWRRFAAWLFATGAGGIVALFVMLAALDPWDALPIHLPLPRVPSDHNLRWAYPAFARDPRFDSAVFGNSTGRLLDPSVLDPALSARFVNLAILGGQAFEEARLMDAFIRVHPRPGVIIVGLDRVWCERDPNMPRYMYGPIPDWLYDGDTLGVYRNLLSLHAIDTAWRTVSEMLGLSPARYGTNGYNLIWFDKQPFSLAAARGEQIRSESDPQWQQAPGLDPASWPYPALDWLARRLDTLPDSTRKLLVFVPNHRRYPPPGPGEAMIAECKRRVAALVPRWPNTMLIDFAIPSAITDDDDNWWDSRHIRAPIAEQVTAEIARAATGQPVNDAVVLAGSPPLAMQQSAAALPR